MSVRYYIQIVLLWICLIFSSYVNAQQRDAIEELVQKIDLIEESLKMAEGVK